jgi:hypothetical protein
MGDSFLELIKPPFLLLQAEAFVFLGKEGSRGFDDKLHE